MVAEELRKLPADSADAHKDYVDSHGRKMLAVAARVGTPAGPSSSSSRPPKRSPSPDVLERQLLAAIALALLGTVVLG